jgi:thiol-disulfide isomerase/thioredoxin
MLQLLLWFILSMNVQANINYHIDFDFSPGLKTNILKIQNNYYLINGEEQIQLEYKQDKPLTLVVPIYGSTFILFENNLGKWQRDYKGKIIEHPLRWQLANKTHKYDWKIQEQTKFANKTEKARDRKILVLKKHAHNYSANIQSSSGDYRYLTSVNQSFPLWLYGHDGAFGLTVKITMQNENAEIVIYSYGKESEVLHLKKDELATLANAGSITRIKNNQLNFRLEDLSGKLISLNDTRFKDKPKIVQIFGSWCPNCIDEAQFIANYLKTNPKSFEIITLCFERMDDRAKSIQSIKKVIKRFQFDHTFLLASFNSQTKVPEVLPMLEDFQAFPTSIYLNAKNEILAVHTGFNGPATGELFTNFQKEFAHLVQMITSKSSAR